jgi:RPA family protein
VSAIRETYWRVFSTELNSASYLIEADEEMKPTYQLSRLGAMINRVLVAGVLTEKENIGTEDEPMWRGRIQDIAGGTIFINIGRFQPDAAASMNEIDTPSLVAVVGKVKSYTNEDRTYISVRPERIVPISEDVEAQWILDTAKTTWNRLVTMKRALNVGSTDPDALVNAGIPASAAPGIAMAIDQYGQPDSGAFLKPIQAALRKLLPDKNVDLGLVDDSGLPDEFDVDDEEFAPAAPSQPAAPAQQAAPAPASGGDDREGLVLSLLTELNDGKGAPRDLLESRCADEGISSMELEEIIEGLLDKGLAYEPNLKYIKRIDD